MAASRPSPMARDTTMRWTIFPPLPVPGGSYRSEPPPARRGGRYIAGDGEPERPRAFGRAWYTPAPDHPHEREAAGPRREQARAVLRARGDGRRRHPRGGDHRGAGDRRDDPRGDRGRIALRD